MEGMTEVRQYSEIVRVSCSLIACSVASLPMISMLMSDWMQRRLAGRKLPVQHLAQHFERLLGIRVLHIYGNRPIMQGNERSHRKSLPAKTMEPL